MMYGKAYVWYFGKAARRNAGVDSPRKIQVLVNLAISLLQEFRGARGFACHFDLPAVVRNALNSRRIHPAAPCHRATSSARRITDGSEQESNVPQTRLVLAEMKLLRAFFAEGIACEPLSAFGAEVVPKTLADGLDAVAVGQALLDLV